MVRKVGDDQGGTLVTSLAYSAFVAVFPLLLLLLVTVLGFVLGHNDDARDLGLGGGQPDDRDPAELGVALDIGQHLAAMPPGQVDVEEHEVRPGTEA